MVVYLSPFCYCEEQRAYEDLEHALSEERLDRDYEEEEAHLPYLALSFLRTDSENPGGDL